ncbi:hypothetical protein BDQ17DRAFT_1342923, partial [Cyathus striatus]
LLQLRDSDYYFPDGNVIFKVEDTLFKVHKSILSKDSTFFKDLFSVPQPETSDEGSTDDNPIPLSGDTAKEFHALLWSLYALPAEIFNESNQPNAERFGDIACMAHKYQFSSTEEWAAGRLKCKVDQWQAGKTTFTANQAVQVTKAAVLCKSIAPDLYENLIRAWKKAIVADERLSLAIDVGEKYGIVEIEGLAYYRMMLLGRNAWESEDPPLSRTRRVRLLNGHYTLLNLANELPDQPPRFPHSLTCTRAAKCAKYWQRLWKRITEPSPDGLLTQLRPSINVLKAFVDKTIPHDNLVQYIPEGCLSSALEATMEKVRETRLKLLDFFVDVE